MYARRCLNLILGLALVLFPNSAFAFDATDTTSPKLISVKLVSEAKRASDLIVLEITTEDDKNWVTIGGRFNTSYFYYNYRTAFPICNPALDQPAFLNFMIDEISRSTQVDGSKRQTFLLSFFSPRMRDLPAGCEQTQTSKNLSITTSLCGPDESACVEITDEVGRSTVAQIFNKSQSGGLPDIYSQIFFESSVRAICALGPYTNSISGSSKTINVEKTSSDLDTSIETLQKLSEYYRLDSVTVTHWSGQRYSGTEILELMKVARSDLQQLGDFLKAPTYANLIKQRICSRPSAKAGRDPDAAFDAYSALVRETPFQLSDVWMAQESKNLKAAESLINQAKAAQEAASAQAKAQAEAEARAKAELEAKLTAEKVAAEAKARAEAEARTKAELDAKLAAEKAAAEAKAAAEKAAADAAAKAAAEKASKDAAAKAAAVKKKMTITCLKGKISKKVTGINPKCPSGYVKK